MATPEDLPVLHVCQEDVDVALGGDGGVEEVIQHAVERQHLAAAFTVSGDEVRVTSSGIPMAIDEDGNPVVVGPRRADVHTYRFYREPIELALRGVFFFDEEEEDS